MTPRLVNTCTGGPIDVLMAEKAYFVILHIETVAFYVASYYISIFIKLMLHTASFHVQKVSLQILEPNLSCSSSS